ncbi:MAG: SDR family NAD(P)-dependent oxidoreductase [Gammaproteobacteria bacterium]|nr:SDR family NAD(P)-dependent oxidoreductase [Gammaproteobacteria bacterium]
MTKTLRVWITGASSGIGRAVALEMAKRNYQLVISGRNQVNLQELATLTQAEIVPFDVTDKSANLAAAAKIKEMLGGIDIVFLNAGNCEYIDIKQFDSDIIERMIKTNFLSMAYGVEAALPLLRNSSAPHLVAMSSSVAYFGLPRAEGYGASKAAIRSFFQSLRIDLMPEKIPVSIVLPGFIKTPLTDKNDFPMPQRISAENAAKKIVDGIEAKKQEIITPYFFPLFLRILGCLPSRLASFLVHKMTSTK